MSATKSIDGYRPIVTRTLRSVVTWAVGYGELPEAITPRMEELAAKLNVAVAKLAEFTTPDEIAAFLGNQGAKGTPRDSNNCVLAKWLQKAVGYEHTTVGNGVCLHFHGTMAVIRTPAMLTSFYRNFDQGLYPGLVA